MLKNNFALLKIYSIQDKTQALFLSYSTYKRQIMKYHQLELNHLQFYNNL